MNNLYTKKLKFNERLLTKEYIETTNYLDLLDLVFWNHFQEYFNKDKVDLEIKESYCGKAINGTGGMLSSSWNDPNYTHNGYIRTLSSVEFIWKQSNYTHKLVLFKSGNMNHLLHNHETNNVEYSPLGNVIKITNWMLENNIFYVE